jgi:hypothetical protein
LFFVAFGAALAIIGLLNWIFREEAESESPTHYWFWFSSGPYIKSAEGRVEHVVFMSKVQLGCGVPILAFGVLEVLPLMTLL